MKKDRMARVNRLIQTTLAELLPAMVNDPRVSDLPFMAVTAVRTVSDLSHSRVYLSIPASPRQQRAALEALEGARGFVRSRLSQEIKLRHIPELRFFLDDTLENAAHIEQVLDEIHAEAAQAAEEREPAQAALADETAGEEEEDRE